MRIQSFKKNVTLFGLTTIVTSVLVTGLLFLFVLPSYKNELVDTKVNAAERVDEVEVKRLIEEYLSQAEVTEYIEEAEVKKLTGRLLEQMKSQGIEPSEGVKTELLEELERLIKQEVADKEKELNGVRQELIEKIAQEAAVNQKKMKEYVAEQNIQGQLDNTKIELDGVSNNLNSTRMELQTLQSQLNQLQSGIGNCIVRYNAEDGHFYSVYNEGTEQEVSKKLDFAQ